MANPHVCSRNTIKSFPCNQSINRSTDSYLKYWQIQLYWLRFHLFVQNLKNYKRESDNRNNFYTHTQARARKHCSLIGLIEFCRMFDVQNRSTSMMTVRVNGGRWWGKLNKTVKSSRTENSQKYFQNDLLNNKKVKQHSNEKNKSEIEAPHSFETMTTTWSISS